jgi:hypothetical protein
VTWTFWLYAAGGLFWSAWALAYGLRSAWWYSPQGRASLASWTSLAAVLDLAAIFRAAPLPHAVAVALAAVVLSAVAVTGAVQLAVGLWLQGQDRDQPHRRASDHR